MPKIVYRVFLSLVFFLLSISTSVSAWNKVEDVFSDISKDYIYYNELQTLYDKGMIFPDSSWKFNAKRLLNRDEFVWISMEVTCQKCISPNTDFSLIQEYSTALTFYDVAKTNKYFYCIAEADNKWYVKWYDTWYTCENNEVDQNRKPFCVDNKITLEEALAVILRNSGIFTVAENRVVIEQINAWKITQKLADDITPKWPTGGAYTFYWYFKEALDFELLEYDENGEQKIYKLLELTNNKARPGQSISKEDFLRIAYIALKANSCVEDEQNELAVGIDQLDKICEPWTTECNKTDSSLWEDTFDFSANIWGICSQWIDDNNWYTWKFYNVGTWNEIIKKWAYLDNYTFLEGWKWRVSLYAIDNCGNTGEVYITTIVQWDTSDGEEWATALWLQIWATPLKGGIWIKRDFECIVTGWNWSYNCVWDFWNWLQWEWMKTNHTFNEPWTYRIQATATDSDGNTSTSTVVIVVTADTISSDDIIPELAADIKVTPKYGIIWTSVEFEGIAEWGTNNYKYIWDYWDGSKWSGKNQSHIYENSGRYLVKLTVVDSKLNRASSTVSVVVINQDSTDDISSLGVDIIVNPLSWGVDILRDFQASVEWWDWNYSYQWDFWDGDTSREDSEKHIYSTPGVYVVSLVVTDWEWNTWTSTLTIVVNDNQNVSSLWVEINASPLEWWTNIVRNFEAIVEWWDWDYTYEWDFWDGKKSTWTATDHVYENPGVYIVTLTAIDWEWNMWYSTVTIVVTDTDDSDQTDWLWVDMNISPREWWIQTVRNFEAIVEWWNWDYTYEWNFWDDSTMTGENVDHLYEENGIYEVILIVTDWEWNTGKSTSILIVSGDDWEMAIKINVLPKTTLFIWEEFNFVSIIEWWDWEYTYNWNLGDNTVADYKNTQHKYSDPGWYNVVLEVKDGSGKSQKTNVSVTVEKKQSILDWINVDLSVDPYTVNVWTRVNFKSIVSDGWPDYFFSWAFWDWWNSSVQDPQHVYNVVWTYSVSLFVTDQNWKDGSARETIIVVNEDVCLEGKDTDWDWVTDCDNEDKCPTVAWSILNQWCPILEQSCNSDCSCDLWYQCSSSDPLQCWTSWLCQPQRVIYSPCLESWQSSLIYGNVSNCNSCPCLHSIDFNSTLRKCDTIFPAITSPDFTQIYSRGEIFNIK